MINLKQKKIYAFNAVFRVDVNDVKPFQDPTGRLPADHFLDPQSMLRLLKTKPMVESNFAFIETVSTIYYGGQAGYAPINVLT